MKSLHTLTVLFVAVCLTAGTKLDSAAYAGVPSREDRNDLPEGMAYHADSLLNEWKAKNYLVVDADCWQSNVNPYYRTQVYIDRLRRIPAVMELAYNDVVRKFIDQYSGSLRRSVSYMLGACNFYIPIFEEALSAYGLPLELKYLPVIESTLNPRALSRAGAAGLWQFMLGTGRYYGLEVNSLVDERYDPVKSSYAAAHYLSDLYKIFGDWNLVIAAYNCGPNAVNKAILRADGSRDYWVIYPHLPRETRDYVPAFIAANYIMNYYCEHNICPMKTTAPIDTDTLMLSRDVHFKQIAAVCDMELDELRSLNPQYRTGFIPGSTGLMSLRLPQSKIATFINSDEEVFNYRKEELLTRRDVVNVAVTATPVQETQSHSTAAKKSASRASSPQYITVRSGQTLSELAKKHGTTVSRLRKLNGIKGSNIRVGQRIRVR